MVVRGEFAMSLTRLWSRCTIARIALDNGDLFRDVISCPVILFWGVHRRSNRGGGLGFVRLWPFAGEGSPACPGRVADREGVRACDIVVPTPIRTRKPQLPLPGRIALAQHRTHNHGLAT